MSKGFVQVYWLNRNKAKYERLKNISAQTTGMSGVLTITTDAGSYVLRTGGKSQREVDRVLKLVSAGHALLNDVAATNITVANPREPRPAQQPNGNSGLADQLQKLADLRNSGALTDEEFEGAKACLLATD
jgi:hypothetical protein